MPCLLKERNAFYLDSVTRESDKDMPARQAYLPLNDGHKLPQIGLGTWLLKAEEAAETIRTALDVGYRHIDSSPAYENESAIGPVIQEFFATNKIKRSELCVTSKIWNTFHSYGKALENAEQILAGLGLDYLDILLIHWPQGYQEGGDLFPKDSDGKIINSDVDYLDTWRALEHLKQTGKVRSIGLSNFNHVQIQRILDNCKVKPAVIQVELNPYLQQKKLREYCHRHDIAVVAFCSLGNNAYKFRKPEGHDLLNEPVLREIAQNLGKTTAQVVQRWTTQLGVGIIPKSTNKSRMLENLAVNDFSLNSVQMADISSLDRGLRLLPLVRDSPHPHYPFHEEY